MAKITEKGKDAVVYKEKQRQQPCSKEIQSRGQEMVSHERDGSSIENYAFCHMIAS